jgi:hypothetical protein
MKTLRVLLIVLAVANLGSYVLNDSVTSGIKYYVGYFYMKNFSDESTKYKIAGGLAIIANYLSIVAVVLSFCINPRRSGPTVMPGAPAWAPQMAPQPMAPPAPPTPPGITN